MSSVTAINPSLQSPGTGQTPQEKIAADLQALAAALKADDNKAALSAMVQLQIDTAAAAKASGAGLAVNPLGKVADALQTGNLPIARVEFSRFETAAAAAHASTGAPA